MSTEQRDPMAIRNARAELARATGHAYRALDKALEDLPREALYDLRRLIDNLKRDAIRERTKRRRGQFW